MRSSGFQSLTIAFSKCRSGNFALVFALVVPLLLGLAGGAIDMITFKRQQAYMQQVADAAALAAAREAAIKNWSQTSVQALSETMIDASLRKDSAGNGAMFTVAASADKEGKTVRVRLEMNSHRYFLLGYFRHDPQILVEASASVSGDMPVCVIALEPDVNDAMTLKDQSSVLADQCAVHANSKGAQSVFVDSKAKLESGSTCMTGGYGGSLSRFVPAPTTDCPPLADPLAARPAPSFGSCDHTGFVVKDGTFTIQPGVYCKGLLIDNDAIVDMKPGIYVINGGEFRIRNGGSLKGEGVGIYFTGADGRAVFDGTSKISLSAPETGEMAGLLWYQDRAMDLTEYEISSISASDLLGTIYLPNGRLKVHAVNPIAENSAFTVIVARFMDIGKLSKLYINSGYSSTSVPVPSGLGPNSDVRLSN